MIHLDTCFLIRGLLKGSPEDRLLREWLRTETPIAMSALSWTEFLCGPVERGEIELASHIVQEQVPFLSRDSSMAARLFNFGGRRRGSLVDCMVAAVAIRSDAELATSDLTDFGNLEPFGLKRLHA